MRARHRHLKPSSLGATIAYDSRYINESDNTTIQTWSDRSGNARDLSQSDSAKRPTFKTAIQGGCGAMRFDGSNDSMSTASYSVANTTSGLMVIQSSQNSTGIIFERSPNFNSNDYAYLSFVENNTALQWSHKLPGFLVYASGSFATRSTSWCIVQFNYNGDGASFTLFSNGSALTRTPTGGVTQSHGTGTLNAATFVGARNNAQFFYNGDMGALVTIPSDVGDPMRKRLNHHAAFSWKISCN
jgi:hypothetical protein